MLTAAVCASAAVGLAPGYKYKLPGQAVLCPRGTYNPGYNLATNCTSCPEGVTTDRAGLTDVSACKCGWCHSVHGPWFASSEEGCFSLCSELDVLCIIEELVASACMAPCFMCLTYGHGAVHAATARLVFSGGHWQLTTNCRHLD